ncbi:MAG: 50S ribosomal protein L17 [Vampirovibrionales bacterium]|nr:50S ribosomal protein L17 [Vampirovibrionales bacterium]
MRHRNRLAKLARPADQRKAIIRSLLTKLFLHDEIVTTKQRARVVRSEADKIITLAKRGDLAAIRLVSGRIYRETTGNTIEDTRRSDGKSRQIPETVLRRIFRTVAERAKARTSGYTRILPMAPRRGDNAPMALLQLVDAFDLPASKPGVIKTAPIASKAKATEAPEEKKTSAKKPAKAKEAVKTEQPEAEATEKKPAKKSTKKAETSEADAETDAKAEAKSDAAEA